MRAVKNIQEEKWDDCSMKKRKSEDTPEADEPESEKKEKKGIIYSLPMEKQRMRSVANIHEEKSDDPSIKERKFESTIEVDKPESEPEEEKGISNPLPVKKRMMRSMSNMQEEESDDASIKERKFEDTIEADEPEPKENIIDPLPVRKRMMRSVANIQEENSDDFS